MANLPRWFQILFGIVVGAIVISVIVLFTTKTSTENGVTGPKGATGSKGIAGDSGAQGAVGPNGTTGISDTSLANSVLLTVTPNIAVDNMFLLGAPTPASQNFPSIVSQTDKIVTICCSQIGMSMNVASNTYYLRFQLPVPLASIDPNNLVYVSGFCYLDNQFNTNGFPVLATEVNIISTTMVRIRYISTKGNIWNGGVVQPTLASNFTFSYITT